MTPYAGPNHRESDAELHGLPLLEAPYMKKEASRPNVTRGFGLLELFLSRKRAKTANRLIPAHLRKGRILDIGCGLYPLFLANTDFAEKYGLDQVVQPQDIEKFRKQKIVLLNQDLRNGAVLPFDSGYFSVVTMLAVIEHIELEKVTKLISEVYRLLRPAGRLIITTPAPWAENVLKVMTKLCLISAVELAEHKWLAARSQISNILQEANFPRDKLQFGYFEMSLNIWVTATK